MSKNRYIDTHFWKDNYIIELDPSEKLLFLYLLSNPHANIAGIYEISIREISFDTGFDRDLIVKLLDRFTKDNKIYYLEGYIYLANSIKHQKLNPSIKKGIDTIIKGVKPIFWEELAKNNKAYTGCIEALTYININLNTNSNINTNINSNEDSEESSEDETSSGLKKIKTDEEIIKDKTFSFIEKTKVINRDYIKKEHGLSDSIIDEIGKEFIEYWTEPTKNGKKIRYDLEKSFGFGKRFGTFIKNYKNKNKKSSFSNFNKKKTTYG